MAPSLFGDPSKGDFIALNHSIPHPERVQRFGEAVKLFT